MLKFETGSRTHNEMYNLVGIILTWLPRSHAKIYVRHGSHQNAALVLMRGAISLCFTELMLMWDTGSLCVIKC